MYTEPPSSEMGVGARECCSLWSVVEYHEPKIQDLVMHMLTVKEMWNYLDELYSEKNNLNRAFDVIQEMLKSKKSNKILSQHYANFNRAYELKVLFFISQYVKKMQKQWDQLAVLTFLESLPSKYIPARPQVIDSFTVDSLSETSVSSKCLPGGVTESCWERVPWTICSSHSTWIIYSSWW